MKTETNHMARSLADLITARQLSVIFVLARQLGISADAECRRLMETEIRYLSRHSASMLIRALQEKQK